MVGCAGTGKGAMQDMGWSVGREIMERADPTTWQTVVKWYNFIDRHRDEIDLSMVL